MGSSPLSPDRLLGRRHRHHLGLRRPDPPRHLPVRPRRRATGVTAARGGRALRAAPQRRPPPPREAGRRRLPRGRHRPRRPAGAGRPSKRYRVTGARRRGLEFPVRHDDLLVTLLGKALVPPARRRGRGAWPRRSAPSTAGRWPRRRRAGRRRPRPARSAPRCTPSPTPSPPTGSPPTPRAATAGCASSPSTARSATPPSSTRSSAPSTAGMVRGMLAALYGETTPATEASVARGDDVCVTAVE